MVAVLGAMFALTGSAVAGDDTMRLDMKKPAGFTLTGGAGGMGQFTHDARAKATDDDLEDVHYRYGGGYSRGYYGGGYYGRGYYGGYGGYGGGYYGRGYYGGYGGGYYGGGYYGGGYYPSYYSYYRPYYRPYYYGSYYPSYSYPSYSYPSYYAAPVAYYYPCGGVSVAAANDTLQMPRRAQPMPRADEPPPRKSQPMDQAYPYDGPPARTPSYRYNGDPMAPVPMPPADTNPSRNPSKGESPEGRVVSLTSPAKKLSYPAYGDNRRKADGDKDRTIVVKHAND